MPANTKHSVTAARRAASDLPVTKHPAAGRRPRIVSGSEILFYVVKRLEQGDWDLCG